MRSSDKLSEMSNNMAKSNADGRGVASLEGVGPRASVGIRAFLFSASMNFFL